MNSCSFKFLLILYSFFPNTLLVILPTPQGKSCVIKIYSISLVECISGFQRLCRWSKWLKLHSNVFTACGSWHRWLRTLSPLVGAISPMPKFCGGEHPYCPPASATLVITLLVLCKFVKHPML